MCTKNIVLCIQYISIIKLFSPKNCDSNGCFCPFYIILLAKINFSAEVNVLYYLYITSFAPSREEVGKCPKTFTFCFRNRFDDE